uniref:Pro-cathepsin H n=1 Tax=Aceria tosichella TaxID=561515 RepID=A0A6G1SPN8_9ACAR
MRVPSQVTRIAFLPLVITLVAVALSMIIASGNVQAQEFTTQQQPEAHPLGGLLSLSLTPIRSAVDHASRFLGGIFGQRNGAGDSSTVPQSDDYSSTNGGTEAAALTERTFEVFMRVYNKSYTSPEEFRRRFSIVRKRLEQIRQSVVDYARGRTSFMMGENPFIDREDDELSGMKGIDVPKELKDYLPEERQVLARGTGVRRRRKRSTIEEAPSSGEDVLTSGRSSNGLGKAWYDYSGDQNDYSNDNDDDEEDDDDEEEYYNFIGNKNNTDTTTSEKDPGLIVQQQNLPASKDWRASQCIWKPMDQGSCGCCYAIATMDVIASMRCLRQTTAPALSAQQIIDCSTPRAGYQNFGCKGGWPTRVLKYLQDTRVATRDSCYPFVMRQQYCQLRQVQKQSGCTVNASPTDTRLTYQILNNERDIHRFVATTGPVVTVMKATSKFLMYFQGVFDDQDCTRHRDDVDHAIVIVGYGRENGMDYWLIKNSWGERWGMRGYGKYRRGRNACSIGHWGWAVTS